MNKHYDAQRPREVSLRGINVDTALVTVAYGDDFTRTLDFGLFRELVEQGRLEEYMRADYLGGIEA
jgi:hypothetical protein